MAQLSKEQAKQRVHDAGLRATGPRIAVLRLLAASDRPLSHSEVAEALGNGDWDKATLYRNLIKLVDSKLARVASHVGGIIRYEAQREDGQQHVHPHFACRDCGTVQCLTDTTLSLPSDSKWRTAVADAELQVVGQCPGCRSAQRRAKRRPSAALPR